MSGIACMVFTKERPLQLHAFLRSAERYAPYESMEVNRHLAPQLFEEQTRTFLAKHERVVFHTDDDVFFREAKMPPRWTFDGPPHSYRLGRNTRFQHPTQSQQDVPPLLHDYQRIWHWRWREADGDFGYPLCLNATVYRSADLLPLLDFHFDNPTSLEAQLAAKADEFAPEWMTAPLHSCCVSIPYNRVTIGSQNPISDDPRWTASALKELWDAGYRLDIDKMDFSNVIGAHQVIEPKFLPCLACRS